MGNENKIILHLCASRFGSDSKPYKDAGYDVRLITEEIDVRKYTPPKNVYGIIANPPCTMFSIARGMNAKKPRDLREGMELVKACLDIIWECMYDLPEGTLTPSLKFWAMENPGTGLLRYFLGKPVFTYQPYEYGENFTKKTSLWGNFNPPVRPLMISLPPKGNSPQDRITPMSVRDRRERTDLRSIACKGFTEAFYRANP